MRRWLKQAETIWNVWRNNRRAPCELEVEQRTRLTALVDFARVRSPYYKRLYEKLPPRLENVSQLPTVTKSDLMSNFDDWVTDPTITLENVRAFLADDSLIGHFYLQKYAACFTSGTTGGRAIFLQDQDSLAVERALTLARGSLSLAGNRRPRMIGAKRRRRTATVIATGGHYAAYSAVERLNRRFPRQAKYNRTFSILTPLSDLVLELNEFQPSGLNGYPNSITVLAHEQEAGRLKIRPQLVVTGGETLDDVARERIAEVFGCAALSWYGAAEAGSIAYDCGQGWLHLNSDWVILEPVDQDYRPVAPGQESDMVLLTNLANRVQPVIRYVLGDRIVFNPDRCSCGSLLPAIQIAGRSLDIPTFISPDGEQHKMMPVSLETACSETPGVQRHQLVQSAADRLTIRFEPRPGGDKDQIWQALLKNLRGRLIAQGLSFVEVVLDPDPPRADPTTGKYRVFAVETAAATDRVPRLSRP